MSRAFTLGIQGPDGQRRVTISETESVDDLYKVTQKAYHLPSTTDFVLTKDLQKQIIIKNTVNTNLSNYNLRHGDRLFLHYNKNISPSTSNDANAHQINSEVKQKVGCLTRNNVNIAKSVSYTHLTLPTTPYV